MKPKKHEKKEANMSDTWREYGRRDELNLAQISKRN